MKVIDIFVFLMAVLFLAPFLIGGLLMFLDQLVHKLHRRP